MSKPRICKWCKSPIFYDAATRMYFINYEARRGYYCPKDENEDRCQHIPERKDTAHD
jgi:hypothetical protein